MFHIDASLIEVNTAITSIEGLSNWWTAQTSGSSQLGDLIDFRFGDIYYVQMKVVKLEEQSIQWRCIQGADEWVGTTVSFDLDSNDNKTRLRFNHDKWPTNDDFYALCSFSWARYMESLRQYLQTGKGQPFQPNK